MNPVSQFLLNWEKIIWPLSVRIGSLNDGDLAAYQKYAHVTIPRRTRSPSMPLNASFVNESDTCSDDVRTDADERVCADRIRAGDMEAFEALYRAYWQRLYVFAFRYG